MKSLLLILGIIISVSISAQQVKNFFWGSTGNPLNGLTVTWESSGPADSISWGYTQNYEQGTFPATQMPGYNSNHLYSFTFPELDPSSLLYYKVYDSQTGDYVSKNFETAEDASDLSFTFSAGGDSRGDEDDFINPYMRDWEEMAAIVPKNNFTLFTGDIVEDGDVSEQWEVFFEKGTNYNENNLTYHCIGNHDNRTGNYFTTLFTQPGNELYYAFEYGHAVFICLDSENNSAEQDTWLIETLQQSQHKMWKIVLFHRPFFTIDNHAGEMDDKLNTWWQAFEDYNVDVIFNGHSHYYIRTEPIRLSVNANDGVSGYGNGPNQGIMQVIAGGMGAFLSIATDPFAWFVEESFRQFHYISASINQNTFSYQAIKKNGDVIDEISYSKNWPGPQTTITAPASGTYLNTPESITITAEAYNDAVLNFSISQIEFFVNGNSIGIDTEAPYEIGYTPDSEGIFQIYAIATNSVGSTGQSDAVYITVGVYSGQISCQLSDYAEERVSNGEVDTGSGDLELIREPGWMGLGAYNQIVGVRFNNIQIPQGAIIDNAFLQFKCDETNNDNPCNLTIQAQSINNAPYFQNVNNNVSNRSRTSALVNWSPSNWDNEGEAGINQRTPNIAACVQEVVDRPEWHSGNGMAFIITGEGRRTAESGDVELIIEYTINPLPEASFIIPFADTVITQTTEFTAKINASDVNGTITHVNFYYNDIFAGVDAEEPYQFTFSPDYDTYLLKAVAYDNNNDSTLCTRNLICSTIPEVSIAIPTQDTIVSGMPEILIVAQASDVMGGISEVQLLINDNPIATINQPPWQINWQIPAVGEYSLVAKATNNYGVVSYSEPRYVIAEDETYISKTSDESEFIISPNPFTNIINIDIPYVLANKEIIIKLISIDGVIVFYDNFIVEMPQYELQAINFAPGIYFLNIKFGNGNYTFCVAKE
jgi:hypothetical protein